MKLVVKEYVSAAVEPIVKVFRIHAEAVDSVTKIPVSLGLEKGDILVYQGAGIVKRLPVGSNGQVLTADSTSELGVKWA